MNEYGVLQKVDGRYRLRFERITSNSKEIVWQVITNPQQFAQWYPFATGKMDLQLGGRIYFDDGEGSTYEGIITELVSAQFFAFREIDDLLQIELKSDGDGCRIIFTHTFDDSSMAVPTAAGWHRCLDVLGIIINGDPIEWVDNAAELRQHYQKSLG